jgi:hypothetical protein
MSLTLKVTSLFVRTLAKPMAVMRPSSIDPQVLLTTLTEYHKT